MSQQKWHFVAAAVLAGGLVALLLLAERSAMQRQVPTLQSDVGGAVRGLFGSRYPAGNRINEELQSLRKKKKISSDQEILVSKAIADTSPYLHVPPAVLWCLLYQESHLNHLEGVEGSEKKGRGLGHLTSFNFHEVNHDINRYTEHNLFAMKQVLGSDVRPVQPRQKDHRHPSSYFHIPTAVVTSGIYLNNRFHQLKKILELQKMPFNQDLLWLSSALAYHKGTRAVLQWWNEIYSHSGRAALEKTLTEKDAFFTNLREFDEINRALRRAWPERSAAEMARELVAYGDNLKECSVSGDTVRRSLSNN